MGEEAPRFESDEVDLPPAPPNIEADPAAWKEYNKKREELEKRQIEKEGSAEN